MLMVEAHICGMYVSLRIFTLIYLSYFTARVVDYPKWNSLKYVSSKQAKSSQYVEPDEK